MDSHSGTLLGRFTALKDTRSGLQTWISVGGWSFTDPGPTRSAFSDMTSLAGNRQKFISGLISFMDHYGFDGVDLDWEVSMQHQGSQDEVLNILLRMPSIHKQMTEVV